MYFAQPPVGADLLHMRPFVFGRKKNVEKKIKTLFWGNSSLSYAIKSLRVIN